MKAQIRERAELDEDRSKTWSGVNVLERSSQHGNGEALERDYLIICFIPLHLFSLLPNLTTLVDSVAGLSFERIELQFQSNFPRQTHQCLKDVSKRISKFAARELSRTEDWCTEDRADADFLSSVQLECAKQLAEASSSFRVLLENSENFKDMDTWQQFCRTKGHAPLRMNMSALRQGNLEQGRLQNHRSRGANSQRCRGQAHRLHCSLGKA